MQLDRRAFLHCSLAAAAPLVLRRARRAEPFRLSLVTPAADDVPPWLNAAVGGARFGAEEASHTFVLLGREIEMTETTDAGAGNAAATVSLARHPHVSHAAPVVDARVRYSEIACGDPLFRIGLDDEARAAARAVPPADAREVAGADELTSGDEIVLWHAGLSRYGATQLNERYRRRFGVPMDEHAWAAWMAVKILAEAALRARDTAPGTLTEWLTRARVGFDGHKGEPLAFDSRRRLIQPVYHVAGGRILQLPHPYAATPDAC